MRFDDLDSFLSRAKALLARGPVALILADDAVEIDTTLRHHIGLRFRQIVLFGDSSIEIAEELIDAVLRVDCDMRAAGVMERIVNGCIRAAPGTWFYYGYNAEYLFYPFCENRSIGEMTTFSFEERRDTILTFVVDLYAGDLSEHPGAVSLEDAHLDKSGYYALARTSRDTGHPAERQLDFFGGLRWRFEEHVPPARRRIDRVGIFRAKPGLVISADHTFNDPEYNTYACPWHNNLTAAICSFRTAKALKRNPGSAFDIRNFRWHNSAPFNWHSQQLLDLGLMEPGQWF